MSVARTFLRYWLPPLLWMTLIFWGSTDALSSSRTSRIIGPLLRWFNPAVREETIQAIQGVVRKSAHVSVYALLTLLYWRALYRPRWKLPRPWSIRCAVAAFALAVLYAMSDEFHQSFVASREGSARDVGFDAVGAVIALLALWSLGRWRGWWGRLDPLSSDARAEIG